MIGAMVEAAAVRAAANPARKPPTSRIIFSATSPGPAASANALPLMEENATDTSTVTWPRPPLRWPTAASAARHSRVLMVPAFMILAARMNIGTASRT